MDCPSTKAPETILIYRLPWGGGDADVDSAAHSWSLIYLRIAMNLWQMPEQELIIHPTLEHTNLNSWAICNGKERGALKLFTSQVAGMKDGGGQDWLVLPQSGGCAKSNLSAFDCYHICIFHS